MALEGHEVFAVTREPESSPVSGVTYLVADLAKDNWEPELPKEVNQVFHFAQSSKFRDFPESASDVFGVNVEATFRLLEYARKSRAQKFVFASSGGVYESTGSPKSENQPIARPKELGFYLGSKAAGEILCQGYASILQTVILRPFFMFGSGQKRSMLLPRIFDAVESGSPIILQGSSGMLFNPIHVSDAAQACIRAAQLDQSLVVNLGGPEVLTLRELALLFGRNLGKDPVFERALGEPSDFVADTELMRSKLWRPQVTVEMAIGELKSDEGLRR